MPDIKNIDPSKISDKEFKIASDYVEQTINILDMELRTSNIPIGMFLVGIARFLGHKIHRATTSLGPERREEQIKAFSKIIEVNATDGDDDGETSKIS